MIKKPFSFTIDLVKVNPYDEKDEYCLSYSCGETTFKIPNGSFYELNKKYNLIQDFLIKLMCKDNIILMDLYRVVGAYETQIR